MKRNEEKLTAMVEAVISKLYPEHIIRFTHKQVIETYKQDIRTALTPFCMEMTDEEIEEIAAIKFGGSTNSYKFGKEEGFEIGAKFIRDGK